MDELIVEGLGGLGMVAVSVLYTRWQTSQNKDDITKIKNQIEEKEKVDSSQQIDIQVLKTRVDGIEVNIIKKLDELHISYKENNAAIWKRIEKQDEIIQKLLLK